VVAAENRLIIPYETRGGLLSGGEEFYVKLGTDPWETDYPPGDTPRPTATARLTYDSSCLYVHLRSVRPADELTMRREHFGEQVCCDSCLEFFFAPVPGDNKYFNFEANPSATLYVGFSAAGTRAGSRLLTELTEERVQELFRPGAIIRPAYREVSYRIPYTFIREYCPEFTDPVPGDLLRANFYSCCDDAPQPHYTVWHNVTSSQPDYHRPEDFGELEFGGIE